jgi:hypothetical protein
VEIGMSSEAGRAVPRRRSTDAGSTDAGSAVLEFIVVGVGLLVPLVYLVLAVGTVQSAVFASSQAVREAGRAFGSAPTPEQGRIRAVTAASLALADHGLVLPRGSLRVACPAQPCLTPGSVVDVTLAWAVPLPWLPTQLSDGAAASIPISATHRVPIDEYRGTPGVTP